MHTYKKFQNLQLTCRNYNHLVSVIHWYLLNWLITKHNVCWKTDVDKSTLCPEDTVSANWQFDNQNVTAVWNRYKRTTKIYSAVPIEQNLAIKMFGLQQTSGLYMQTLVFSSVRTNFSQFLNCELHICTKTTKLKISLNGLKELPIWEDYRPYVATAIDP